MSKKKAVKNFVDCYQNRGGCHAIVGGVYFPSTEAARWSIMHKHTGDLFPSMEKLGIDIHKAKNLDEILNFISRHVALCAHCGANNLIASRWQPSSRKATDWIE